MRVHHLNCGTMCPFGAKLLNGDGGLFAAGRMVCHCLLIETNDGLVLVDTGLGLDDVREGSARLGSPFMWATRPRLDENETAARQVEKLGWKREDVRHIVPTHLDLDHAGGLADFPKATVHIFEREHAAALHPLTTAEANRYRQVHWAHGPKWNVLSLAGETWNGFDSVRALAGVGTDVLLVPLLGHTRGHVGVAVKTGDRWLLHGGDAFFSGHEMESPPSCPPSLRLFQRLAAVDNTARLASQARLRELVRTHADDVDVVSAHCPFTFERFVSRAARTEPAANGVVAAQA